MHGAAPGVAPCHQNPCARSHGATATANCVKNHHKMALYPAMMGSLRQWMFADPITVNGSCTHFVRKVPVTPNLTYTDLRDIQRASFHWCNVNFHVTHHVYCFTLRLPKPLHSLIESQSQTCLNVCKWTLRAVILAKTRGSTVPPWLTRLLSQVKAKTKTKISPQIIVG